MICGVISEYLVASLDYDVPVLDCMRYWFMQNVHLYLVFHKVIGTANIARICLREKGFCNMMLML